MKTLRGTIATLFAAILTAGLCLGQAPVGRKSYTFHGKVVSVNKDTQRLTVNGERVDGWMAAMTMNYQVDDPSLFTKLKPGDHVLHSVRLAPTPANGPASGQAANKPPTIGFHRYRVPQDRFSAFWQAQRYGACNIVIRYDVDCQGPAVGNFGQVELDSNNKPFVNGRPVPPPNYPIPATPPPAGVAPAQQTQAELIFNRASELQNNDPRQMPPLYQCALMGDRRCEATLGIRFQDGDVIKADDHAAAYWFGVAAAQGHRGSQYALAGMYQEREGRA